MSYTDEWHPQILDEWDIVHYANVGDVLRFSDGTAVRMLMSDRLREIVSEYTSIEDRMNFDGARRTGQDVQHCVRRMRYALLCIKENGYWLIVKLSRDRPDLGCRIIVEFAVVAPIYHRVLIEGTTEAYKIHVHRNWNLG